MCVKNRCTKRCTQMHTDTDTDAQTQTQMHRHRHRCTDTDTDAQTQTQMHIGVHQKTHKDARCRHMCMFVCVCVDQTNMFKTDTDRRLCLC